MPAYKLTYFKPRALAEPIRLVFRYAGVEFEDIRLTHEEWPMYKDSFPYQQLPLLELEDGKELSQSGAILRYLARKFDLNGKSDFEEAKLEEIWLFYYDNFRAQHDYNSARLGRAPPGTDIAKLHKEIFTPIAKRVLPVYYKLILSSNSGFILPSGLSYIDFVVAEHLHTLFQLEPELAQQNTDLVKYKENIHSLPQIADYVKSRPQTIV